MCGIVYHKSFKNRDITKAVLKRYKAQRTRGLEGFGFFIPQINRLTHHIREGRILSLLQRNHPTEVLFHHRWPTSTENVRNACHPFSTHDFFDNNYVMVHNGVVSNAKELQAAHQLRGIEYVSLQDNGAFNDSEALLYDLALYLEGEQDELKAQGSIAFIVIQTKDGKPGKMYYGHNFGSPLWVSFNENELILASEKQGQKHTYNVPENNLYTFDYTTNKVTFKPVKIPSTIYAGYNYDKDDDYTYASQYSAPSKSYSSGQDRWSNKYWTGVETAGDELACDFLEEGGFDQALGLAQEHVDSLTGRSAVIVKRMSGLPYTDEKRIKLAQDQRWIWESLDIARCALDILKQVDDDMLLRGSDQLLIGESNG